MSAIRLAVFDIDGTLLDAAHPLRANTLDALRSLHRRGIVIALASSRPLASLQQLSERLAVPVARISHNGGYLETAAGETLQSIDFTPGPVLSERLHGYVAAGGALHAYAKNRWLAFGAPATIAIEENGLGLAADRREHRPPRSDELSGPWLKILCYGDLPELERIRSAARAEALIFSQSGNLWFDIHHASSGKRQAVQRLCQHLGLDAEAVATFGDSDSDAEMLAWAGQGIAIGEASEAARLAASHHLAGPGSGELERYLERLDV